MTGTVQDSGKSHRQSRDVSQGVQIGGAVGVTDPEAFLAGSLKAGVVTFTFRAQGISAIEAGGSPVNGKSVSIRNGTVFGASSVFPAVVPVFMVTGTTTGFGLAERAAKFLAQAAMTIGCLTVFVHSKARIANGIAGRELVWIFCVALV